MSNAPVQPGDVLAAKYRVERVLGVGGMGVVVQATHVQLDERVALKFMLPEALANADVAGRFLREARLAVKLQERARRQGSWSSGTAGQRVALASSWNTSRASTSTSSWASTAPSPSPTSPST